MNRAALLAVLLLALLLVAPELRADDAAGLQLARQARQKLAAGDPKGALELLDRARTELPGSDVVACTRGDALASLGKLDDALNEYARASTSPLAFHAAFNGASSLSTAGEAELSVSGVPADVGALPEGPQPEMLAAIQSARPRLERSRAGFLNALDLRDDADARESVGALNRRLDALKAIEDELNKRREDEKQKDENKDKQDQQDPQNKDQQDQKPSDQPQDQKPQDQQDQQNQQDQPPQDQPQDEPKEDPEKKDEPAQPQDAKDQQAQPDDKNQPPAKPAQELSEQEVQQLLDTLAQLEDAARERQKAREMRAHKKAARDW